MSTHMLDDVQFNTVEVLGKAFVLLGECHRLGRHLPGIAALGHPGIIGGHSALMSEEVLLSIARITRRTTWIEWNDTMKSVRMRQREVGRREDGWNPVDSVD